MSQSTPTYIRSHERGPYYTSMLNAEATPFNPLGNLLSSSPQHSGLRATASVFIAPTAPVLAKSTNKTIAESTPKATAEQIEKSAGVHTNRKTREHHQSATGLVATPTSKHAPFDFSPFGNPPLPGHDTFTPATFSLDGMPDYTNDYLEHLAKYREQPILDDVLDQNADYFTATTAPANLLATQQDVSTHGANHTGDYATEHHYHSYDAALEQEVAPEPNASTFEQYDIVNPTEQFRYHHDMNSGVAFDYDFPLDPTASAVQQSGKSKLTEQHPHYHDIKSSAAFLHGFPLGPITSTFQPSGAAILTEQGTHHHDDTSGAAFDQEFSFEPISCPSKQCGIADSIEQNHNYRNVAYTDDYNNNTFSDKSQYNSLNSTYSATDIATEQDLDLHSAFYQNTEQSTTHFPCPIMDSPGVPLSHMRPESPPVTPPEHPAQVPIVGEPHVSKDVDDAFDGNANAPTKRSTSGHTRRNGKKTLDLGAAKTTGVKKSQKKGTATAPAPALQAKANAVRSKVDIDKKMRKANLVIAAQKKSDTLAKKMGQHIQLVRENGRLKPKGVYWKAPEDDDTIPSTEEGKATLIQQLVAAMRNNKDCKEVSGSRQFLNRWGEGAEYFSDEELEIAAWAAVDMMVDVHTNGWTSTIMDSNLRDQVQKTMYCTFEDRFGALAKLLTFSKRTCEDFLKNERFSTIVGNPWELEGRTTCNAASNKAKGKLIKAKKSTKRGREEDEDGDRPQKAARSS